MPNKDAVIELIFEDLKSLGIGRYLTTLHFQRFLVKNALDKKWQQVFKNEELLYQSIHPDFHRKENISLKSFRKFLDHLLQIGFVIAPDSFFGRDFSMFTSLIEDFIRNTSKKLNLNDLCNDLRLIGYPLNYEKKIKGISATANFTTINSNPKSSKPVERTEAKTKNKSASTRVDFKSLKSKKELWIKKIAKAETEEVLEELVHETIIIGDSKLLNEVTGFSSRWHRLNKRMNLGTIDDDKANLEANRINKSLLDFLREL